MSYREIYEKLLQDRQPVEFNRLQKEGILEKEAKEADEEASNQEFELVKQMETRDREQMTALEFLQTTQTRVSCAREIVIHDLKEFVEGLTPTEPEDETVSDVEPGEGAPSQEYDLLEDEYGLISGATKLARALLKSPEATPEDIIGLGRALYALERLPKITPGISVEFGGSVSGGNSEYSESYSWYVAIRDDSLEFRTSGSCYDSAVGGDSLGSDRYEVYIDGDRDGNLDPYDWINEIDDIVCKALEPYVDDYSDEDAVAKSQSSEDETEKKSRPKDSQKQTSELPKSSGKAGDGESLLEADQLDQNEPLLASRYMRIYLDVLKERQPEEYQRLQEAGRLEQEAESAAQEADDQEFQLVKQMSDKQREQMTYGEWLLTTQTRVSAAREIVIHDLVESLTPPEPEPTNG